MAVSKPIEIKIYLSPEKFAKLNELMPDWEKGGGEKSTVIYWAINTAISWELRRSDELKPNVSNREYLKRG